MTTTLATMGRTIHGQLSSSPPHVPRSQLLQSGGPQCGHEADRRALQPLAASAPPDGTPASSHDPSKPLQVSPTGLQGAPYVPRTRLDAPVRSFFHPALALRIFASFMQTPTLCVSPAPLRWTQLHCILAHLFEQYNMCHSKQPSLGRKIALVASVAAFCYDPSSCCMLGRRGGDIDGDEDTTRLVLLHWEAVSGLASLVRARACALCFALTSEAGLPLVGCRSFSKLRPQPYKSY